MEASMEEHWKLNTNGSLAGVYALDLKQGKGSTWAHGGILDQVVENWTKLHPVEMAQHLIEVAEVSAEQKNKFASSKTGLRYGCSVPVGLGLQLELVEPDLFSNRQLLHKFMRKFPGFRVAQVV